MGKIFLNFSTYYCLQEKRLCSELRLPAPVYLKMQQVMSMEIFSGNVTKKSDAHHLFQMEPSKVDRVYDMLVRKGLAPPWFRLSSRISSFGITRC